jgi:hypothetical protein
VNIGERVTVRCSNGWLRGKITETITRNAAGYAIHVIDAKQVKLKKQWFWRRFKEGKILAQENPSGDLKWIDTWPIS